ncbi:MAG TPA: hypothetical protein VN706_07165 [Gemmatimonadaceae bacterium]|nr:hypothetical protein [Gemmatimonadaceae bacterium]
MERSAAVTYYEKLIATNPAVERKGDTVPYTSLNGHMFSALHKDNTVALRLPEKERETFLERYRTSLAAQYGVVQPEYVVVPDALLAKTKELEPYFAASYEYVAAMKPKPTTKKKASAKKRR